MQIAIRDDPTIVSIPLDSVIRGTLQVPSEAKGAVLLIDDSGCCHNSPHHYYVSKVLQQAGLASLLLDLLTPEEEKTDRRTRYCLRHSIPLLSERLLGATDWLKQFANLNVGYFASSAGACAALVAAAKRPDAVGAIVSCSGYLDLVSPVLAKVQAPTLLIVGAEDFLGVGMSEDAIAQLQTERQLKIVPGATHSFKETGALDTVAQLASDWFSRLSSEPYSS